MKKKYLFHVIVMVTLGLLLSPVSVRAQNSENYLTLLHDRTESSYGHIIVRIPPNRKVPKDWKMRWYVSTYTPKGHKLSLGFIRDRERLSDEGKLVFNVPIGEYKIEITRRSEQWTKGGTKGFYITEGLWEYSWPDTIKVDDVNVPIEKGDIKIVNISYQNARVLRSDKEKGKRTTLYMLEHFRLLVEKGSPADLPDQEPVVYPIVKYAELKKIDETHIIEALKKWDKDKIAAIALLHCEKPNARLISRALEDKSLRFDVLVARILAKAGDNNAVMPLLRLLEQGSESERYTAAWTLGELKAKEAVDALIAALEDKSVLLRNHAVYALAQIKDERAVDALIEATKDFDRFSGQLFVDSDPEIYIAHCSTRGAGIIGPDLPAPSRRVRENAIYALGQIGGQKAINTLLNLIEAPDGDHVFVIFALSNHKDSKVIDALIKELKSNHQGSRWMAVRILEKMRAKKALDSLADLAQNDSDETVRKAARKALEKIKKAD